MIIINVKENESIDKALKRFKKKFERTGVLRELRGENCLQEAFYRQKRSENQGGLQAENVRQRKLLSHS